MRLVLCRAIHTVRRADQGENANKELRADQTLLLEVDASSSVSLE